MLCKASILHFFFSLLFFLSRTHALYVELSWKKKTPTIFERCRTVRVAIRPRTSAGALLSSNLQRHSVRLLRLLLLLRLTVRSPVTNTQQPAGLHASVDGVDGVMTGRSRAFWRRLTGIPNKHPALFLIQSLRSSESWLRVGGL